MAWPFNFGSAVSPEAMSALDVMFNQVGAMIELPCSPSGTNAISLTPLANVPALTSYNELGGYRFRAAGNSSGAVTAQYNGLGFLNVYHSDGATQASTGDLIGGQEYVFRFSQALNGGLGGFFIESPAQPVGGTSSWFSPGGRLTPVLGTPVVFSNQTPTVLAYSPYVHQFVPIYNGSNIQMYNFCSGLSDVNGLSLNMGGNANWPVGTNFDVYAILQGGLPVLATLAWTNNTTRATGLAIFGGFLTNAGSATMRISQSTTVVVPINQATFLGTFQTSAGATGQYNWTFGAAASGGSAAIFGISNYYNPVLFTTIVQDNGVGYTYSSNTIRQARASTGNQISFVQTSSERAILINYLSHINCLNVGGAYGYIGLGVNSTTASFAQVVTVDTGTTGGPSLWLEISGTFSATGYGFVAALEAGDGANANLFNANSTNVLIGSLWL